MAPIESQYNANLFNFNNLQNLAQQYVSSGMSSNPFGDNFSALNAEIQLNAAMSQSQTFDFSSAFSQPFNFNFDFSSIFASCANGGSYRSTALSGNRVQDALRVAQSQIGVREVTGHNDGAQINLYRNGAANGAAWCASFVSYCYGRGQNSNNSATFGYDSSSQSIRRKAEKAGCYRKANSGYIPQPGDLFIINNGDGSGHVGIVSKGYSDGSFDTIEGNCSNKVATKRRSRTADKIDGFVQMDRWLAMNETGSGASTFVA